MVFFTAKGIVFILRSQATVLWWLLNDVRPTNPQGVKFEIENLRRNAPQLYQFLDLFRFQNSAEVVIDGAGLATSGLLLRLGARFSIRLLTTIGVRRFVAGILGGESKFILGLLPGPALAGELAVASLVITKAVSGTTALALWGLGIVEAVRRAVDAKDVAAVAAAAGEALSWANDSLKFVVGTGSELLTQGQNVLEEAKVLIEPALVWGQMAWSILHPIRPLPERFAPLAGRGRRFAEEFVGEALSRRARLARTFEAQQAFEARERAETVAKVMSRTHLRFQSQVDALFAGREVEGVPIPTPVGEPLTIRGPKIIEFEKLGGMLPPRLVEGTLRGFGEGVGSLTALKDGRGATTFPFG